MQAFSHRNLCNIQKKYGKNSKLCRAIDEMVFSIEEMKNSLKQQSSEVVKNQTNTQLSLSRPIESINKGQTFDRVLRSHKPNIKDEAAGTVELNKMKKLPINVNMNLSNPLKATRSIRKFHTLSAFDRVLRSNEKENVYSLRSQQIIRN